MHQHNGTLRLSLQVVHEFAAILLLAKVRSITCDGSIRCGEVINPFGKFRSSASEQHAHLYGAGGFPDTFCKTSSADLWCNSFTLAYSIWASRLQPID